MAVQRGKRYSVVRLLRGSKSAEPNQRNSYIAGSQKRLSGVERGESPVIRAGPLGTALPDCSAPVRSPTGSGRTH
ncbi:hypothetical protein J6590_018299 [Homalodisca vitripennis]|nr:hypothetical protein J6590_018294 [Homalodisca vitripennis]KAG8312659.1 hypothetical protein J6590_018299 [Homalodisca vitripennis]